MLSVCGSVRGSVHGSVCVWTSVKNSPRSFLEKISFFGENVLFCSFFSCFQVKKKIMRQVLCLRCKDKPENIEIKYFLKKSNRSRFRDHQPYNPPPPSYIFVSTSALVSSPFFGGLLSVSWDFWYYP